MKVKISKTVIGAGLAVAATVLSLGIGAASPASAIGFGAITCSHSVQYAHGSTHVTGTVNVVSTVSCTATMAEIYIRTWLNKGSTSWAGSPNDYFNTASLNSNAATSCSFAPGVFWGTSTAVLRPPAGYSPSSATVTATGASQSVSCNGASRTASNFDETASLAELQSRGYTITRSDDGFIASKDFVFTQGAEVVR